MDPCPATPHGPGKAKAYGIMTFKKTKKRVLTRRGVMWLGQTCNQRCYFCYFARRIADVNHPEHDFMGIDKAKAICRTLREFYRNTSIDIQGGEPTIYGDILELIRYCREIGLYPTLITNGLVLGRPGVLEKYQEAGIRDFLVSLHGIGEVHDEVVGHAGAYGKILPAIERMRELDIPFRFNCTMSKPVVPVIPQIARKAVEYGAYAVNYIAFNPFGDQDQGIRTRENVPRYGNIKRQLPEALDLLEEAGIEANVRYLPLCMAEPRHRKNFYNYQQLPFDTHEWDYESWFWTMKPPEMMNAGGLMPTFRLGYGFRRVHKLDGVAVRRMYDAHPLWIGLKFKAQHVFAGIQRLIRGREALLVEQGRLAALIDCRYRYNDACAKCRVQPICDGFHGDYADLFGTEEAIAVTDVPLTHDPKQFICDQEKTVEPDDEAWAM